MTKYGKDIVQFLLGCLVAFALFQIWSWWQSNTNPTNPALETIIYYGQ